MTEIRTHAVRGTDEALRVHAVDEPGPGGAYHDYLISADVGGHPAATCRIQFQHGPIKEVGVNGVSHEALLAVVAHRLESFQAGPFASNDNQAALDLVRAAIGALHLRTKKRLARGVEGTSVK